MPPADTTLADLGWSSRFQSHFESHAARGVEPGRVCLEFMGGYRVLTPGGEFQAILAGKIRHDAPDAAGRPVVGDWVVLREPDRPENPTLIEAVLPRVTRFSRRAPGKRNVEQVLAANIDTVFLVASLDKRVRPRTIERYLVLARQSGAQPVLVLTKADCLETDERLADAIATLEAAAPDVPVHAVSALAPTSATGMAPLSEYLEKGKTVAILGPSGAGKSTLANHWLGDQPLATGEVRGSDLRGRHTTTHRHLVTLPGGALVIDTPGLRELQLWEPDAGLRDTFPDVAELAASCRFTDCRHGDEPGCEVRLAATEGRLDPARLASFRKLTSEKQDIPLARKISAQGNQRRRKGASYKRQRPPDEDE